MDSETLLKVKALQAAHDAHRWDKCERNTKTSLTVDIDISPPASINSAEV